MTIVMCLVTFTAKRLSIRDDITQIRSLGERHNVMCNQVPSTIVSAPLTCKSVTQKDTVAPTFVLGTESLTSSFRQLTVFERMAFRTTWGILPGRFTDPGARFERMFLTKTRLSVGADNPRSTHLSTCRIAHLSPFQHTSILAG